MERGRDPKQWQGCLTTAAVLFTSCVHSSVLLIFSIFQENFQIFKKTKYSVSLYSLHIQPLLRKCEFACTYLRAILDALILRRQQQAHSRQELLQYTWDPSVEALRQRQPIPNLIAMAEPGHRGAFGYNQRNKHLFRLVCFYCLNERGRNKGFTMMAWNKVTLFPVSFIWRLTQFIP